MLRFVAVALLVCAAYSAVMGNVAEADDAGLYSELLSRVEALEAEDVEEAERSHRLDMLIKFYHPEWTWTAARDCGIDCPYQVNLLDFAAIQWQQEGELHGIFDLEFVNEEGRIHGNMDFYDNHMFLWDCGWVDYLVAAPATSSLRTWTFAKSEAGFKLYCGTTLLLDYTYAEGACANLWKGPTFGFYFETTPQAVHLLQHGADPFGGTTEKLVLPCG